jgi:CRP/FNR family cyclic AMP-dependent transcriptional regulator
MAAQGLRNTDRHCTRRRRQARARYGAGGAAGAGTSDRADRGGVGALERQLLGWHNRNAVSQRLARIPGIGPILATAITTTVADPKVFPRWPASNGGLNVSMPLSPDMAVFQRKLATLPLETFQAGDTVLSAASTTGRLLILKKGEVAVLKEGVEIARVTEPGAVFGELSVLLDQPHTADVRALEVSQFHVADASTILRIDPIALLYVATVLAQRLDSANRGLLQLKRQVQAGEPRSVIGRTVEKIEDLLGATGANLMYAGYPYDPFAPDAARR